MEVYDFGVDTKEILIKGYGYRNIAKESDEEEAVENGFDESIFFYVPDDIFEKSDEEIQEYVENNVF